MALHTADGARITSPRVSAMRSCALPNKRIVRCARYAAAYAGWGSNRAQRRAFLALPRPLTLDTPCRSVLTAYASKQGDKWIDAIS